MQGNPNFKVAREVRVAVREFRLPPVRSGLVLGRRAAVGCHALRKALYFLVAVPFVHLELEDEVISDLIVRAALIKRFPQEQLIAFVLEHVKPLMSAEEILELEIDTEVFLEARLDRRE
jgi:hypothetical protein